MKFYLRSPIDLNTIISILDLKASGNLNSTVTNICKIDYAEAGSLAFSNKDLETHSLLDFHLVSKVRPNDHTGFFIYSKNPKLDFVRIITWINREIGFKSKFISDVSPKALIHKSATVMDGVCIGEGTQVGPNVVIHSGVKIGQNCKIGSGTIIGDTGFNYVKDDLGSYHEFIHFAGVDIGDNVVIGNNCAIDRGVLSNTIIKNSVKIDNLVHIAHNCIIGKGTLIVACAEISGSVIVGENVWIGPGSTIRDSITIEDGAFIGLGSVVTRHVLKGVKVFGNPAKALPY